MAWLHEVFEHSSIVEQELLANGLTEEELRALRLLTRSTESRSRVDKAEVGVRDRVEERTLELRVALSLVDVVTPGRDVEPAQGGGPDLA